MDAENKEHIEKCEEENRMLNQKLSEILDKNRDLHDRVAELDIAMNIETIELKREIEALSSENENLMKEDELFLADNATKDHKIHELIKELQIKQLMLDDTSSYLLTATERIRFLEKKCALPDRTDDDYVLAAKAEGPFTPDIHEHEKELEEALEKKEHEIETLSRDIKELRDKNKHLATEKVEIGMETSGAPESRRSLEDTLWQMEHSLKLLGQRLSNASEITGQEKEEIFLKLDDAHREIFSLREYHRSILEAMRMTEEDANNKIFSMSEYHRSVLKSMRKAEKENEALKAKIRDFLREKDLQDSAVQERQEEDLRKFHSEQAGLLTDIEKAARENKSLTAEKATLEVLLKKTDEQMAQLSDMLSAKNEALEELKKLLRLQDEKTSGSTREFNEKLEDAVEKANVLEEVLVKEQLLRTSLEDALKRKDMVLEELHEHFIADTERLKAEAAKWGEETQGIREDLKRLGAEGADKTEELAALKEQLSNTAMVDIERTKLREEAAYAQCELRRLESEATGKASEIKALKDIIAEHEASLVQESRKGKELSEQVGRLEDEQRLFAEVSSRELKDLQNLLHEKELELGIVSRMKEGTETQLKEAGKKISGFAEALDGLEASRASQVQYAKLAEENELLSLKLADASTKAEALHEIKTFVSDEIRRLAEQVRTLKEEDMTKQDVLKGDIRETLKIMSQSAERFEQAISEGGALARKLDDVSASFAKEHLPVVPDRPLYYDAQQKTGKISGGRMVATLVIFITVVVLAGIFFRRNIVDLFHGKKEPATAVSAWAAGVKTARSGGYDITVTFLNKEAVNVLGYSELIPDSILRDNDVALIVVKAGSVCIPEDFISSPEKNISFINDQGGAVPLNAAGPFSEENKTIFKKNACNGKPGAVYLKHLVATPKLSGIKGLDITGLQKELIAIR